jgi:hypothetical protein
METEGWEGDETRERLWFDQMQELLKADAEAYWAWCEKLERELEESRDA